MPRLCGKSRQARPWRSFDLATALSLATHRDKKEIPLLHPLNFL